MMAKLYQDFCFLFDIIAYPVVDVLWLCVLNLDIYSSPFKVIVVFIYFLFFEWDRALWGPSRGPRDLSLSTRAHVYI